MFQLGVIIGAMAAGILFGIITERMGVEKETRDALRLSISFGFGIGPVILSLWQK